MPDQLTLDVIDRPAAGAVPVLRRLNTLNDAPPPGVRALVPLSTGAFVPRVIPQPTPGRIGMLTIWDAGADVDARWEELYGRLPEGAGEHWHVRGELTRAAFTEPWRGWEPDAGGAEPLGPGEPALILISGQLKARWLPVFTRDAAKAIGQALDEEGYLGGLALLSSPLNTTSCSAWRAYADARRYAYASGAHQRAMKRDKAEEHHSTEYFVRIRPLAERGTLDGSAPFAGVLAGRSLAIA